MEMSRRMYKARMLTVVAVAAAVIGVVAVLLLPGQDDDPGILYMSAAGRVYDSVEELTTKADLVVVGTVTRVAARAEDYGTTDPDLLADYEQAEIPPRYVVFYEVAVSETLQGQHDDPIIVRGLDPDRAVIEGVTPLLSGQKVLLFLYSRAKNPPSLEFTVSSLPSDQTYYIVLGMDNGVFDVSGTGSVTPRMPARFTAVTPPSDLDEIRTQIQNDGPAPT